MAITTDLKKEANERFKDCSSHKDKFKADFEEAYYFTSPTRYRQMSAGNVNTGNTTRPSDKFELSTSIGIEASEDFATLGISTFFPESERWAKREVSAALPGATEEELTALNQEIEAGDATIFDEIRSSNVMDEICKTFTPDMSIGTVGLHIDAIGASGPIRTLGVPLTELFGNVGPDGSVHDRWMERATQARHLYGLVPSLKNADGDQAEKWRKKIVKNPSANCKVCWGWWRLWDEAVETWQWVVKIDEDVIEEGRTSGEGSCALIIARFGASPEYAFGWGPTLKSLPEFRQLDEQRALMIEALDFIIKSPFTYPADSFINIQNGVEAGKGYPIEPGQEGAIKRIFEPKGLDAAYFEEENCERKIKRLHYIDKPEQRGDTPPTLGQWMSEIELGQRRFGVPGKVFWREGPRAIFMRFAFILQQRGIVMPLRLREKDVIVSAVNPAQRAQDMQAVANAGRAIELSTLAFPEEWKAAADGSGTMKNIVEKLGAKDVIVFRKPEDIKAAVEMIAPLVSGQQAGVDPSGGLLSGGGGVPV